MHWCGSLPTNSPRLRVFHGRNQKCPLLFITVTAPHSLTSFSIHWLFWWQVMLSDLSSPPLQAQNLAMHPTGRKHCKMLRFFLPKGMLKGLSFSSQPLSPRAAAAAHSSHQEAKDFPSLFSLKSTGWAFYSAVIEMTVGDVGQDKGCLSKVCLMGAAPFAASPLMRSCLWNLGPVLLTKQEDN